MMWEDYSSAKFSYSFVGFCYTFGNYNAIFTFYIKLMLMVKPKKSYEISRNRAISHVLFPLFLGGFIYLFFHPTSTILSHFFETDLEWTFFKNGRQNSYLPNFILHHILDGLWAYALTATLIIVLRKQFGVTRLAFISFMFCVFYEYVQYQNWVSGTFDWWDILVMGGFILIAIKNLK